MFDQVPEPVFSPRSNSDPVAIMTFLELSIQVLEKQ